jgi:nucleoside-diphosphate-sugar epimerase
MNELEDSGICNILVTGGGGYLGSVLVPLLLDKGHHVRVLDRFCFGEESLGSVSVNERLTILREDILHHENLPDLFTGIDAVVHLASISNDPSCDLDPNLTIMTNFLASMSLARRAKMQGVKKFIFMSSCSVYGASNDLVATETAPTGPVTLYALIKLENERELAGLASEEFQVTILRLATLFGLSPRMRFDLAVNTMTRRALQRTSIQVHGQGSQYRPFVHVRDAAEGIIMCIETRRLMELCEIYNLGNNDLNYNIYDLAMEIGAAIPGTAVEIVGQGDDIRSYKVNSDKIGNALGIFPYRTVQHAVDEITAEFGERKLADMDDDIYYNVRVMTQERDGSVEI